MTVFTSENVSCYYLSPYVRVYIEKDGAVFRNTVTENHVRILCGADALKEFCRKLMHGIPEEDVRLEIARFVPDSDAEELLSLLIRKGVIE